VTGRTGASRRASGHPEESSTRGPELPRDGANVTAQGLPSSGSLALARDDTLEGRPYRSSFFQKNFGGASSRGQSFFIVSASHTSPFLTTQRIFVEL